MVVRALDLGIRLLRQAAPEDAYYNNTNEKYTKQITA